MTDLLIMECFNCCRQKTPLCGVVFLIKKEYLCTVFQILTSEFEG